MKTLTAILAFVAAAFIAGTAFADYDPATDSLALWNEISVDPAGVGYNLNANTNSGIVKPINDPASNPGGETVGAELTAELLLDAIAADPSEVGVGGQFTDGEARFLAMVVNYGAVTFESLEQWRLQIQAMFGNGDVQTALLAQTRFLSRAEVLFGDGTLITERNVTEAINAHRP